MGLVEALKGSFVAGFLLLAPLVVTAYVIRVLALWSLAVVNPVVRGTGLTQYTANIELVAQLVAIGLMLAAVTTVGFVARWSVGRAAFGRVGRVVNIVPLVNVLYASVRQVATALVERDTGYERVVLVEYPRDEHYAVGFVTGESPDVLEAVAGEPAYTVFLPNSPNPTGGRLVVLPASQLHEVDLSVRRALRLVVTTGMGSDDAPALPAPAPTADEARG